MDSVRTDPVPTPEGITETPRKSRERDYLLHAVTIGLCAHCANSVPTKVILQDGAVYLVKHCPQHGMQRELLEEDANWYLARCQYDKPGTASAAETATRRGCPHDCGLCPNHEQHTCIGLLEVTGRCDQRCPVCFADSGSGEPLPLATIEGILEHFQAAENGRAEVLQISGGEPTTHPQILEIIALARAKRIRYVLLNTNGRRIALDREFARALGRFAGGFEIYLQFDGFDRRTHRYFRGEDLSRTKERALAHLTEFRVPITLVATVEAGVNDHELGHLVEFGLNHPAVRGLNFQPVSYAGRHPAPDAARRITLTGILRRIERQMGGMLKQSDFLPLPCDPDRVAVTFLYRNRGGFTPVTRHLKAKNYLSLFKNTLAFYPKDVFRQMASRICSGSEGCSCLGFLKDFLPLAPLSAKAALSSDKATFQNTNVFRITVTSFLDRLNFEMKSMMKECVHVLTPDLRRIPFSAYNMLYRGADRRELPGNPFADALPADRL